MKYFSLHNKFISYLFLNYLNKKLGTLINKYTLIHWDKKKKIQENFNEGKQIAIFQVNCSVESGSNIP